MTYSWKEFACTLPLLAIYRCGCDTDGAWICETHKEPLVIIGTKEPIYGWDGLFAHEIKTHFLLEYLVLTR